MLKPEDIPVLGKMIIVGQKKWTYQSLANEIGMTGSVVHGSIKRLVDARLLRHDDTILSPHQKSGRRKRPISLSVSAVQEFLIHGLQYAFYPELGAPASGIPVLADAAPFLNEFAGHNETFVWPHPKGKVRGTAIMPIHRSIPEATIGDPAYHEIMNIIETLRAGGKRERESARQHLKEKLSAYDISIRPTRTY